jgi:hypothetical protein
MMADVFLTMPEYRDKGQGKFSFFLAAFQIKKIRERIERLPGSKKELCRWIGEGKIPEVTDMKLLPDILDRPSVKKRFEETAPLKKEGDLPTDISKSQRKWFDDIYKVVQMDEPEKDSGPNATFHKAVITFNDQIGNISNAGMKEMETDEMLHRRLTEIRETLDEFMSKIGMAVASVNRTTRRSTDRSGNL